MQRGGPWAPKRGVGMVWGWHRGRGQGQVTGKTQKTQGREHCPGPALVGTKWVETERDLAPQSGPYPQILFLPRVLLRASLPQSSCTPNSISAPGIWKLELTTPISLCPRTQGDVMTSGATQEHPWMRPRRTGGAGCL